MLWRKSLLVSGLLLTLPLQAETFYEMSGKASADLRYFTQNGQFSGQNQSSNLSFALEPEFYWEWNDGVDSLTFTPFLRVDENDSQRTHGDIRELSWVHAADNWELRVGLRKEFWGVTEFQHLVDVINQTDAVEDFDGEDKLGQQMINLSLVRDWGIVDLYLLPGFRERTFPGQSGRLRSGLVVMDSHAEYESDDKDGHIDTAIRWSHTLGDFDLGAYWFHGTNRDPILRPQVIDGKAVLTPYYEQMDQVGFDLQATIDSWLWKVETIHRDSSSDTFWAAQAGFEYTFYGIQDSSADLGMLIEYGWDERGEEATTAVQNDLFFGARLALNDEISTEMLAGIGYDLDYDSQSLIFEASHRIGDNWKVSVDGRFFSADDPSDLSYNLRQDDHLQITMERYF